MADISRRDTPEPEPEGEPEPAEPEVPEMGKSESEENVSTATKSKSVKPSAVGVLGDAVDKLTDVLNFGRILSIGLPGFVAAFAVMMLIALVATPSRESPVRGVLPGLSIPELGADSGAAPGRGGERAEYLLLVDSVLTARYGRWAPDETGPRPLALSSREARRVVSDFKNVYSQWFVLLVATIMLGALISQLGYRCLNRREEIQSAWRDIVRFIQENPAPKEQAAVIAAAFKPLRNWADVTARVEEINTLVGPVSSGVSYLAPLRFKLLRSRCGLKDRGASWSNLHLPLLRKSMPSSGETGVISYHDHLTKEYWRFTEFALNFPIAAAFSLGVMGLYLAFMRFQYAGSLAWQLGLVLLVVSAVCWVIYLRWWSPDVAYRSYRHYQEVRSGMIAGLVLMSEHCPELDKALAKVLDAEDVKKVKEWYAGEFQRELKGD